MQIESIVEIHPRHVRVRLFDPAEGIVAACMRIVRRTLDGLIVDWDGRLVRISLREGRAA